MIYSIRLGCFFPAKFCFFRGAGIRSNVAFSSVWENSFVRVESLRDGHPVPQWETILCALNSRSCTDATTHRPIRRHTTAGLWPRRNPPEWAGTAAIYPSAVRVLTEPVTEVQWKSSGSNYAEMIARIIQSAQFNGAIVGMSFWEGSSIMGIGWPGVDISPRTRRLFRFARSPHKGVMAHLRRAFFPEQVSLPSE